MARLTDSDGRLLGGLDTSPARQAPHSSRAGTPILAPSAPPFPPKHEPDALVIGLKCDFGSLACLTFAASDDPPAAGEPAQTARPRPCRELVEDADRRHDCPSCGGSYCAVHADPAAHHCRSVLRTE